MMRSTLLSLSLILLGSSAFGVGCGDDDGESPAVGGSSGGGTGGSSGSSGTGGAAGSAGRGGAAGSAGASGTAGSAGAAGVAGADRASSQREQRRVLFGSAITKSFPGTDPPLPFTLGSFEPWSLRVGCCPPQLGVACKTIALTSNLGTTSRRLVQLHSERADKVFGTLGATELQRPRLSLSPAVRNLQSKCTRSRTPNKPCLRTRCKFYNSVVQIPTCSREPGPCRDQVLRAHLLPVAQFPSARDSS
jgi:hypothetical protein